MPGCHCSRFPYCLLLTAFLLQNGFFFHGVSSFAAETASSPPSKTTTADRPHKRFEIPPAIRQAEEKAATLQQQHLLTDAKAHEAAEKGAEFKQRIRELEDRLPQWKKSLSDIEARLKTERAAAKIAQSAQEKTVQQKVDEKKLKEAEKTAAAAADQVRKSEMELQELQQRIAAAGPEKDRALKEIAQLEQLEKSSAAAAEKLQREWRVQEQQIEALLKESGLWVSFASEIAPVLAGKCLACHNSKKAEGGLNLQSYAGLREGGESGAIIDPKNPEQSSLLTLIADGSMPKDADPLPAEERALFERWVRTGGRLDQGVNAAAELIQIMPRRAQPAPPQTYRLPLPVTALAFNPDGTLLASSGYHEIQLWDVKSSQLVRRISNIAERVYQIDFSPDGTLIAVAAGTPGRVGEVKVFQTAKGTLAADLLITSEVQLGTAFSPDGTRLATCGADRKLRMFDVKSRSLLLEMEPHLDWVTDVEWSAEGGSLLTCGLDKTVRLMDAKTGNSLMVFNGHTNIVNAAAFLPGGKEVVSAGGDKVLRVWSISDAHEVRKIGGFGGEISALAVLPDLKVVSAGLDQVTRIHQASDGKQLLALAKQPEPLYALAVHSTAGLIATGSRSGEIQLWTLADGKLLRKWMAIPPLAENPMKKPG